MAEIVLFIHAAFVLWNVFGIFFVWRRPHLRGIHLATLFTAVAFGIYPGYCPLTAVEDMLRERAFSGSFISRFLERIIYWPVPSWLIGGLTAGYGLFCLWLYLFSGWLRGKRVHKKPLSY